MPEPIITIDASKFLASALLADKAVQLAVEKADDLVGDEILRLSQKEVPHDEGTLASSGSSDRLDGAVWVGYHTPYAARLHEHPEYNFQKGRKGKYLEDPIKNNFRVFREFYIEEAQNAFRGGIL